MDDSIEDIQALIGDTQAGLLREIEDTVLRKEVPLQSAAAALAEVDALLALSSSARDLRLVRPRVVSENVIYIKGGEKRNNHLLPFVITSISSFRMYLCNCVRVAYIMQMHRSI